MLVTIKDLKIFYKLLIILVISILVAACGTTSNAPSAADSSDVEISEPAVEVSSPSSESQGLANSAEPRLENLPVSPADHDVEFRAAAPEAYTVQEGDTLWDISNRFLVQPWFWPEIWHLNPQINNPHLIYPGDVLNVFYVDGKRYLTVGGGPRIAGAERLSPKIRSEDINAQSFGIPIQAIQQFIIRPRVLSEDVIAQAPYIVGSQEERLAFGSGDRVYVRGFAQDPVVKYTVFRQGDEFIDPESSEILGYEAIYVGDGEIIRDGDPATFDLAQTKREALRGDRLFPSDFGDQDTEFVPHAPDADTHARVISLSDAIAQIGSFQVLTLNVGDRDGIEKGHVLALKQAGRDVLDPFEKPGSVKRIQLPEERVGIAMVFRTFDKVSYALVMETTHPIQIGDAAVTP